MKKTVRLNCFETNSSSVHCLVMCTENEYTLLNANQALIEVNKTVVVPREIPKTKEQIENNIKRLDSWLQENEFNLEKVHNNNSEQVLATAMALIDDGWDITFNPCGYIDDDFETLNRFNDRAENSCFDTFESSYCEVVAFGYYGSDY